MFFEGINCLVNLDDVKMIKLFTGSIVFCFEGREKIEMQYDSDNQAVTAYGTILEYLHSKKKLITNEEEWT